MKNRNKFFKIGTLGTAFSTLAPSLILQAKESNTDSNQKISYLQYFLQNIKEWLLNKWYYLFGDNNCFSNKGNKSEELQVLEKKPELNEEDLKKLDREILEKIEVQEKNLSACEEKLNYFRNASRELTKDIEKVEEEIKQYESKKESFYDKKRKINQTTERLVSNLTSLDFGLLFEMTSLLKNVASSSSSLVEDKKTAFKEWYKGLLESVKDGKYIFNFDVLDKKIGIRDLGKKVIGILENKNITLEKERFEDSMLDMRNLDLQGYIESFADEEKALIDEYKNMSDFIFYGKYLLEDYAKCEKNIDGLKECIIKFDFELLEQKVRSLKENLFKDIEGLINEIETYIAEYAEYFNLEDLIEIKESLSKFFKKLSSENTIIFKDVRSLKDCLTKVEKARVCVGNFKQEKDEKIERLTLQKKCVDEKIKKNSDKKEVYERDISFLRKRSFDTESYLLAIELGRSESMEPLPTVNEFMSVENNESK